MKKNGGFTLIELMIVVAVLGILVAIAYPSYNDSLRKGTRGAAKAFLLDIVQREQQYLLDNRSYATYAQLQATGLVAPSEVSNFYTIPPAVTVAAGPPPTFSIQLTPITGKRQAKDGWLKIDQAGTKDSQQVSGNWP